MKLEDKLVEYLQEGLAVEADGYKFKLNDGKECFKIVLEKIFGKEVVSCKHYDDVVHGQGKEEDKIDTIYSSSLQSLLIFSSVIKKPIYIDGIKYDEVHFEYKNKVFGYPSCIDVVLVHNSDEEIEGDKGKILFIESKFAEIIRDSSKNGSCVIGPSYFSKDGYPMFYSKDIKSLNNIGIETITKSLYNQYNSEDTKKAVLNARKENKTISNGDAYFKVSPIKDNTYVYSYGVKQVLAHLLGIHNFKNTEENDKTERIDKYLAKCRNYEIKFLVLYNEFPKYNYKKDDAAKKISDFVKHLIVVKDNWELEDQERIDFKTVCMSYQEIYDDSKNREYFEQIDKVADFYHLKEKNDKLNKNK
ncbi:MAG: hypothetical protein HUJ59_04300 [Bacilli bacterium]|nr:hypothetical protein [Bacilli bacterium]MCF0125111.1 hypothetical protein [Clostridia bacterium]